MPGGSSGPSMPKQLESDPNYQLRCFQEFLYHVQTDFRSESKRFCKLLRADACLTEYAVDSSNFYFLVIWNDATLSITPHHNMASRLPRNNKA